MSTATKRTAKDAGLDLDELINKNGGGKASNNKLAGSSREMQGGGADGKKHSLDSDEEIEDNDADGEKLDDDDIEGQEEITIEKEGEIKITPFNLKEEQEEGHFAKDGNFVWKKEKEIADTWLDNVDWVKVKELSKEETAREEAKDEEEDEAEEAYSEIASYKECLKLLRPGESVAKAIRRLAGGKKPTTQRKWQQKNKKNTETEEEKKNRELMTKLSGYADTILSRSGNMEIYEETYEKIAYLIKQHEEQHVSAKPVQANIPEDIDEDDALDLFADNLDQTPENKDNKHVEVNKKDNVSAPISLDDAVRWEFKWMGQENGENDVHGPHSSEEMLAWQDSGYFDKGVFVRKVGSSGDFLDGRRVDFELYT